MSIRWSKTKSGYKSRMRGRAEEIKTKIKGKMFLAVRKFRRYFIVHILWNNLIRKLTDISPKHLPQIQKKEQNIETKMNEQKHNTSRVWKIQICFFYSGEKRAMRNVSVRHWYDGKWSKIGRPWIWKKNMLRNELWFIANEIYL